MFDALKMLILERVREKMAQNPKQLCVDLLECCKDLGSGNNLHAAGEELIAEGLLVDCRRGVRLLVSLP